MKTLLLPMIALIVSLISLGFVTTLQFLTWQENNRINDLIEASRQSTLENHQEILASFTISCDDQRDCIIDSSYFFGHNEENPFEDCEGSADICFKPSLKIDTSAVEGDTDNIDVTWSEVQ